MFKIDLPDDYTAGLDSNRLRTITEEEEEELLTYLLLDQDVCDFIMYYWIIDRREPLLFKKYQSGYRTHDFSSIIDMVKSACKERRRIGAVKLWRALEGSEGMIYFFILAFCGFKVTTDGRIISCPQWQTIEKKVEKTTDEKIMEQAGYTLLNHLLPGLGLLAKWEDKHIEKRQYQELIKNEWKNPLDNYMETLRKKLRLSNGGLHKLI